MPRIRSKFNDFIDEYYPELLEPKKPKNNALPDFCGLPKPHMTVSGVDLFYFISQSMTLRGTIVFWKRDGGRDLVRQQWGAGLEVLLSFKIGAAIQMVRYADVAWMLTHKQPIPEGSVVTYSDGNASNRDPHNLWLTHIAYPQGGSAPQR